MGKIILIIFVVIVVLAFAFAVYWRFFRQADVAEGGFLDYVKDPDAPDCWEDIIAERDAAVSELAKKPPTVLVEMLLEDADPFEVPCRAIEAAGPRVMPALLSAVTDPRFRGGNQKMYGELPLEPLEGVLHCLQQFAPQEAVPVVMPLVKDKREEVRKEVALLFGVIANDEVITPVKQLLQDEDEYVRSYAIRGIDRAIDANRISDGFRREMFEAVLLLVFKRTVAGGGEDASNCLLRLDREKAIAALTDPSRLKADQENLDMVLAALREAGVVVDEASLFKILSELDGKKIEYPETRVMGEILMMLAMTGSERVREAMRKGLEHPSQDVRESAAQALALDAGIDATLESTWERLDQKGWQGLSAPQRHVVAVKILVGEVDNGGFFQYFVNTSGNHWRDAKEGLDAIGASGDKQLFEQVLKWFGSELPSEDRTKRHAQVAKIASKDEKTFDTIETTFYKDEDDREVLLLKYMLKNADEFKK